MKKLIKDLKTKSLSELEKQKIFLMEEITKLKMTKKLVSQKDTNLLMKKRKQLAALLTVITEKKELEKIKKII